MNVGNALNWIKLIVTVAIIGAVGYIAYRLFNFARDTVNTAAGAVTSAYNFAVDSIIKRGEFIADVATNDLNPASPSNVIYSSFYDDEGYNPLGVRVADMFQLPPNPISDEPSQAELDAAENAAFGIYKPVAKR